MAKIKHIHSSSRYDRSPASLTRAAYRYMEYADLITFTEINREARENALRKTGWGLVTGDNGGYDDCGILYDTDKYRILYAESYKLSNFTFWKRGGRKSTPNYAAVAVLEDRATGKRFVVGVTHLPSSVKRALRTNRTTSRTKVWLANAVSLRRRLNKLRRRYKAHAAVLVADWNIDIKKRWVQVLIKSLYVNWRRTWRSPFPRGGTYRRQLIDGTLIRGKIRIVRRAFLFKDDDSSDHRPYLEVLRLT